MSLPLVPMLDRWAVRSQQQARRNAMVATREATRRRIERDEVAAYVAARATPVEQPPVAAAR